MKRMITIIELSSFLVQSPKCMKPEEKDELFHFLARYPEFGDEIPDTGGVRKLRWSGKGKGKRGGLRIIYYFYNESAPIFLLTVYSKGAQETLDPQQKSQVTTLAKILKAECKAVRKSKYD